MRQVSPAPLIVPTLESKDSTNHSHSHILQKEQFLVFLLKYYGKVSKNGDTTVSLADLQA